LEFEMKARDSHRLEETYRRMSDGELLQLGADVESLTDAARAALDAELRARNLEPASRGEIETTVQPTPPEEPAPARSTGRGTAAMTAAGFILLVFSAALLFITVSTPILLWGRLPQNPWLLVHKLINSECQAVLACWGIVTAIGILRLRSWARVSGVLICSLLAYNGSGAAVGGLVTLPALAQTYGTPTTTMVIGTGLIFLGIGGLGALGASFLNSQSAQVQFGGDAPIPSDARPLAVTCIGIWLVAAWPLALALNLLNAHPPLLSLPSIPFASFLSGRTAVAFQYVIAGVAVALGVGILCTRSWARIGVLGLCAAAFLSALGVPLKPNITAAGAIVRGNSVTRPGVAVLSLWDASPFMFTAWLLMKRWRRPTPGGVARPQAPSAEQANGELAV